MSLEMLQGILSPDVWCSAAMKSLLESGGGVEAHAQDWKRSLNLPKRRGSWASAMAPPNEGSANPSASHSRILPAHSADRRNAHILLWSR